MDSLSRAGRAHVAGVAAILTVLSAATPAWAEAVCYRLPFGNIGDRWGATAGRTNPHRGVDFPQAAGTAIPAVADGVVKVNTWNSCLGNVIVVGHADGMFSGYSHMNGRSGLGVRTRVTKGQTIGHVGNTGSCSRGAHLHLTMSRDVNGYYSGTTVDPIAYINSHTTCAPPNKAPIGAFDQATCTLINGWAQDPDEPSRAIAVHVYLDGPDRRRPPRCSCSGARRASSGGALEFRIDIKL